MTASAVSQKLSPEEREILEQFDRRALHPVADVEYELEMARQAARNTFPQSSHPRDDLAPSTWGSIVKKAGLDE